MLEEHKGKRDKQQKAKKKNQDDHLNLIKFVLNFVICEIEIRAQKCLQRDGGPVGLHICSCPACRGYDPKSRTTKTNETMKDAGL